MTLAEILAPILGTTIILVVLFLLGASINIFLAKTEMGARIKSRTAWMGWYEDVDDDYTNFTIHRSNYTRVSSR